MQNQNSASASASASLSPLSSSPGGSSSSLQRVGNGDGGSPGGGGPSPQRTGGPPPNVARGRRGVGRGGQVDMGADEKLFLQTKSTERQQGPQTRRRDVAYDLEPPSTNDASGQGGAVGKGGRGGSTVSAGPARTRSYGGKTGDGGGGGAGGMEDDTKVVSIDEVKQEQHEQLQKYMARERKKKEITEAEFLANFPDAPSAIDFKNITILHRFTLRPDEVPTIQRTSSSEDKVRGRSPASAETETEETRTGTSEEGGEGKGGEGERTVADAVASSAVPPDTS